MIFSVYKHFYLKEIMVNEYDMGQKMVEDVEQYTHLQLKGFKSKVSLCISGHEGGEDREEPAKFASQ
jgi:hypothetical protein